MRNKQVTKLSIWILLAILPASLWWLIQEQTESNVKSITLIKYRLYSIDCALRAYAIKHSGSYPQTLDFEFERTLQSEIAKLKKKFGIAVLEVELPKTLSVRSREEAIAVARNLGPEEIVYCPVVNDHGTDKYFVLGKDNRSELIKIRSDILIFEAPSKRVYPRALKGSKQSLKSSF